MRKENVKQSVVTNKFFPANLGKRMDDDDDDDDDEQLIVLEDDGPDLDDDPGRYAEDAMPDDFFNQFMKHKIPAKNSVNEEERPVPLISKANNSPKEQTGHDDHQHYTARIARLEKDASEANETIRKVEEALRDALDWPLRQQISSSNGVCSREELIGLVKHLKSDVLESRENAIRAREQMMTMKASSSSSFNNNAGTTTSIPSKESINNFAIQLERINREKDTLEREKKRVEYENRKYREVVEQTRETKRDCEIALRKTLARLQKYERAFDAADMKNRELRDRIQTISRRLVESETKVADAKMQEEMAEKRRERAIKEMEKAKNIATSRTERAQSAELRAKQALEDAKEKKKERDELFRETRALEKKCLELATNRNGKNKNSGGHLNEHSRTITELSVLSQELAREEMMTRKRCEDVEKERDLLRLELVSVQAELKAMKEEISRAHERDINYMMSSSGGKVPKGLTYHNEQQLPQQPLQPPPPLQEQTEMKGVGVEATPGFGFFQTTQPATGRVLQFEKENVSVPLVNESVLPSNLETTATETTGTTTTTPRVEKQKNLALLKELAETRRMIKEERAMRLQAEQKLVT